MRKSSHSGGTGDCVEVSFSVSGYVGVRDSKLGAGSPIIALSRARFASFASLLTAASAADPQ